MEDMQDMYPIFCQHRINNKCYKCGSINKVIEGIGDRYNTWAFRALSIDEIEVSDENTRGDFKKKELWNLSLVDLLANVFGNVKDTINGKKSEKNGLFSYSKSAVIALFKYVDKYDPYLVVKKMDINSFTFKYYCYYEQWIKGFYSEEEDDDERNYMVETEKVVAIKEIIKGYHIGDLQNKHNNTLVDLEYIIKKFKEKVFADDKDLKFCDLTSIEFIELVGMTIDISKIDRNSLAGFLKLCGNCLKGIKKEAAYEKDEEIITDIKYDSTPDYYIIKGKEDIEKLKAKVICFLAIENIGTKISEYQKAVMQNYLKCTTFEEYNIKAVDKLFHYIEKNIESEWLKLFDVTKFTGEENRENLLSNMIKFHCPNPKNKDVKDLEVVMSRGV